MKYEEYKPLLDNAMVEYVNNGYSTFYIGSAVREYFFDYSDPMLPYDSKNIYLTRRYSALLQRNLYQTVLY